MIAIEESSNIGFKPRIGQPLHESIEELRGLYYESYGEFVDCTAVIITSNQEFYLIWSKFPYKLSYGVKDSDEFYEMLDFFLENNSEQ